ncbi:hypothetical protein [Herbaspirillum huttiense]|uniref:hypothetical protein n=1 Tax=Herbaspirillum huttiense TaxID=863372 RepID=UPI0031D0B2C0
MNTYPKFSLDELHAVWRALGLEITMLRPKYDRAKLKADFPSMPGSVQAYDELPFLEQQLHTAESAATKVVYMINHHPERPG